MLARQLISLSLSVSLMLASANTSADIAVRPRPMTTEFTSRALTPAALGFCRMFSDGLARIRSNQLVRMARNPTFSLSMIYVRWILFPAYVRHRNAYALSRSPVIFGDLQASHGRLIKALQRWDIPQADWGPLVEEWAEVLTLHEVASRSSRGMGALAIAQLTQRLSSEGVGEDPLSLRFKGRIPSIRHGLSGTAKPAAAKGLGAIQVPWRKLVGWVLIFAFLLGGAGRLGEQKFRSNPTASSPRSSVIGFSQPTAAGSSLVLPAISAENSPSAASGGAHAVRLRAIEQELAQIDHQADATEKRLKVLDRQLSESRQAVSSVMDRLQRERNRLEGRRAEGPSATPENDTPGFFDQEVDLYAGVRLDPPTTQEPDLLDERAGVDAVKPTMDDGPGAQDVNFDFEREVSGYVTRRVFSHYDQAKESWVAPKPTLANTLRVEPRGRTSPVSNRHATALKGLWTLVPRIQGLAVAPFVRFTNTPTPYDIRRDSLGNVWLYVPQADPETTAIFSYVLSGSVDEYGITLRADMTMPINPQGWQPDTQRAIDDAKTLPSADQSALSLRQSLARTMEYSTDPRFDAPHRNPRGQHLANVDRFRVPIDGRSLPVSVGDCEEAAGQHAGQLRSAGTPALFVAGGYSAKSSKRWRGAGHAWVLYFDGNVWKISDATPPDVDGLESRQRPDSPAAQRNQDALAALEKDAAERLHVQAELSRAKAEVDAQKNELELKRRRLMAERDEARKHRQYREVEIRNAQVLHAGRVLEAFTKALSAARQAQGPSFHVDVIAVRQWIDKLPREWPQDLRLRVAASAWQNAQKLLDPSDARDPVNVSYWNALERLNSLNLSALPFVVQAQGLQGPIAVGSVTRWVNGWLPHSIAPSAGHESATSVPFWVGPQTGVAIPSWVMDGKGGVAGFVQDGQLYGPDQKPVIAPLQNPLVARVFSSNGKIFIVADLSEAALGSTQRFGIMDYETRRFVPLASEVESVVEVFTMASGDVFYVGQMRNGKRGLWSFPSNQSYIPPREELIVQESDLEFLGLSRDRGQAEHWVIHKEGPGSFMAFSSPGVPVAVAQMDLGIVRILKDAAGHWYYAILDDMPRILNAQGEVIASYPRKVMTDVRMDGRKIRFALGTSMTPYEEREASSTPPQHISWGGILLDPNQLDRSPAVVSLPGRPVRGAYGRVAYEGFLSNGDAIFFTQDRLGVSTPPVKRFIGGTLYPVGDGIYVQHQTDQGGWEMLFFNEYSKKWEIVSSPGARNYTQPIDLPSSKSIFAEQRSDGWHLRTQTGEPIESVEAFQTVSLGNEKIPLALIKRVDGQVRLCLFRNNQWSFLPHLFDDAIQMLAVGPNVYVLTMDLRNATHPDEEEVRVQSIDIRAPLRSPKQLTWPPGLSPKYMVPNREDGVWLIGASPDGDQTWIASPGQMTPTGKADYSLDDFQVADIAVDPSTESLYLKTKKTSTSVSDWHLVSGTRNALFQGKQRADGLWFDGSGQGYVAYLQPGAQTRIHLLTLEGRPLTTWKAKANDAKISFGISLWLEDGSLLLRFPGRLFLLRNGQWLASEERPDLIRQASVMANAQGQLFSDPRQGSPGLPNTDLSPLADSPSIYAWTGHGLEVWSRANKGPIRRELVIPAVGDWRQPVRESVVQVALGLTMLRSADGAALLVKDRGHELREIIVELLAGRREISTWEERQAWQAARDRALATFASQMGPAVSDEDRLRLAVLAFGSADQEKWLAPLESLAKRSEMRTRIRAEFLNMLKQDWRQAVGRIGHVPFNSVVSNPTPWERYWDARIRHLIGTPLWQRFRGPRFDEVLNVDKQYQPLMSRFPWLAPTREEWGGTYQSTRDLFGNFTTEMRNQSPFLGMSLLSIIGVSALAVLRWLERRTHAAKRQLLAHWLQTLDEESLFQIKPGILQERFGKLWPDRMSPERKLLRRVFSFLGWALPWVGWALSWNGWIPAPWAPTVAVVSMVLMGLQIGASLRTSRSELRATGFLHQRWNKLAKRWMHKPVWGDTVILNSATLELLIRRVGLHARQRREKKSLRLAA